jgi:release factor glutamine methyltransferase
VSGSDISPAAVDVARANAASHGLAVVFRVHSHLRRDDFDLVVANLPYAALDEVHERLEPEDARYQPHIALTAGTDALGAIRGLVASAPPGLRVAIEHSPEQTRSVEDMLDHPETRRDKTGEQRMTVGWIKAEVGSD